MTGVTKVFNALSIIFGIIFIFWLTQLNYGDLSSKENSNVYLGMGSVAMMIFAIQMIKRSIQKAHKNKEE